VHGSLSLSFGDANDGRQWEVQALSARFRAGAHCRCKVVKEGFHLQGKVVTLMMSSYTLPLKYYASANVLSFEGYFASLPCNLKKL
jgi:hypothetical protein